jgi:hypothetical protein
MPDFGQTLRQAFDKSLFVRSSYNKAIDRDSGAYRIEIVPNFFDRNDVGIIGVINERINISMDPEWDVLNLASIVSNFPKIESLFNMAVAPMAAAGVSLTNAGLVTEKFFVKGSYIQIEPTFKVVNWNDDGQPLKAATILLNLCTPKKSSYSTSVGSVYDKLMQEVKNQGTKDSLIGVLAKGFEGLIDGTVNIKNKIVNKLPDDIGGSLNKGIDVVKMGEFMLTHSPPAVSVKIGNYFNHPEMILENISVEFSEEMTKTGPLFAEFKCTLSSKSMPILAGDDKFSTGLKLNQNRITFEGTGGSVNTTGL